MHHQTSGSDGCRRVRDPGPAGGAPGFSSGPADGPCLEAKDLMRGRGGDLAWKHEGAGRLPRENSAVCELSPRVRPYIEHISWSFNSAGGHLSVR